MPQIRPNVIRTGICVLLIGPSGAGKNTVQEGVFNAFPEMVSARGVWTRSHRPGETDETADSCSITVEEFERLEQQGALTAVAKVHGNLYGTPLDNIVGPMVEGRDVIRIVTVDGARAVRSDLTHIELHPQVTTIYLDVPIHVSLERLILRGDSWEDIVRRIKTAECEALHKHEWDYLVDGAADPDEVVSAVTAIIGGAIRDNLIRATRLQLRREDEVAA